MPHKTHIWKKKKKSLFCPKSRSLSSAPITTCVTALKRECENSNKQLFHFFWGWSHSVCNMVYYKTTFFLQPRRSFLSVRRIQTITIPEEGKRKQRNICPYNNAMFVCTVWIIWVVTDIWWKSYVNSTFRNIFTGNNSDVFNTCFTHCIIIVMTIILIK